MAGNARPQRHDQVGDGPGHLIHVGFPKAGSTFLQEWFARHPQFAYVEGGIAGYSNVWDIARQVASSDPGVMYRVTSDERLTIPPLADSLSFAGASAQTGACAALKRLFPDARVLLVTRGFRSTCVSSYSQYVREAGSLDLRSVVLRATAAGTIWDYDEIIRTYEEAFGEQLTVLPYELLRDDPGRFVGVLAAELGLATSGPLPGRVNPSLSPAELGWYPALSRLVESIPLRGRARRRLLAAWSRRTRENRLARLIRLLQVLRPAPAVDGASVTDDLLEPLRGRAEVLRGRSLYAGYEAKYLL